MEVRGHTGPAAENCIHLAIQRQCACAGAGVCKVMIHSRHLVAANNDYVANFCATTRLPIIITKAPSSERR
eukprot:scaffold270323_cov32-Prasinocladus_malaysianus.AAC.1